MEPGTVRNLYIFFGQDRDQHHHLVVWRPGIADSIALCRERLAPLLDLKPGETAFLDGVIDRGGIDTSKLDAPPEVQSRIAAMPLLAWKCQNVRAHWTNGSLRPDQTAS